MMRQHLRRLTRPMPGVLRGDPASIHQARVATRRLREALPLMGEARTTRKLRSRVRSLTGALGPVRELDVALQMLHDFETSHDIPRHAVACLRGIVLAERNRLHGEMIRCLERVNLDKLRRQALAAVRRAAPPGRARAPQAHERDAADRRAARRAERVRAAMENAAGIYLPDRLHEVRIAVKKFRYAMEIASHLRRSRATADIRALRRAQDLLGRMHDLEVLIARTRALQGSPAVPDLRVSGELDRLVRRLETECRQLHGHYMALRTAMLRICDSAIDRGLRARRRASAA